MLYDLVITIEVVTIFYMMFVSFNNGNKFVRKYLFIFFGGLLAINGINSATNLMDQIVPLPIWQNMQEHVWPATQIMVMICLFVLILNYRDKKERVTLIVAASIFFVMRFIQLYYYFS